MTQILRSLPRAAIVFVCLAGVPWAQTATPPSPLHTRDLLWQKMTSEVARIEKTFDGVMGIEIRDLTDGREFAVNADDVFPTASTIKLPMLAELYRQSQAGTGAKLTDLYTFRKEDLVEDSQDMQNLTPGVTRLTNRDLAGFVVAVSDNGATNILIDRVGMDNVNRMLDSLGLHQTRLRRKMIDLDAARKGNENISTPREMATLLEDIYRNKVLNPATTEQFFDLMCTKKESFIPRLLPDSLRIANKPGELDGVRNDAGIVFLKGRPYVVSVMTTYAHDERAAADAISRISLVAYRYFDSVAAASDYGRKME